MHTHTHTHINNTHIHTHAPAHTQTHPQEKPPKKKGGSRGNGHVQKLGTTISHSVLSGRGVGNLPLTGAAEIAGVDGSPRRRSELRNCEMPRSNSRAVAHNTYERQTGLTWDGDVAFIYNRSERSEPSDTGLATHAPRVICVSFLLSITPCIVWLACFLSYDWVVGYPVGVMYRQGPRSLGFWGGKEPQSVCSELTHYDEAFWLAHISHCEVLIERQVKSLRSVFDCLMMIAFFRDMAKLVSTFYRACVLHSTSSWLYVVKR